MKKVLITGGVAGEPLNIAATIGQIVDLPDELADKAIELGKARLAPKDDKK